MEATIILCFITYMGFETNRFATDDASKITGTVLFLIGLVALFARLIGQLI
jgi:hypothetical protein